MIVYLLLHIVTARIFARYMPERMITHRSLIGADSTLPKRWGVWIGTIGSLILSIVSLAAQGYGDAARSPSTALLVQAILYLAVLYMYALNVGRKRRQDREKGRA